MLTETDTYDKLYRDFRWNIPARFNMAQACCDRHADGDKLALIYIDDDGGSRNVSFAQLRDWSKRFANVLKSDGVARGDRVAVFSVTVYRVAHRASRRVALGDDFDSAVRAVRRGRA